MTPWKAARVGDSVAAIDTPALVLDLDAFERNLQRMAAAVAGSGVRLRPHAKSHKCPEIARRQIALGAVGICCQKVSEAAVFVEAGIQDVLITNEVFGDAKVRHVVELAREARIGVLVDDVRQVQALSGAARAGDQPLDVYVEVNVGGNRCGVAPGAAAMQLARQVAASSPLRFAGLQCYHGGRAASAHAAGAGRRDPCGNASRAHQRAGDRSERPEGRAGDGRRHRQLRA